jgi:hypothetical protein
MSPVLRAARSRSLSRESVPIIQPSLSAQVANTLPKARPNHPFSRSQVVHLSFAYTDTPGLARALFDHR